MWGSGAPTRRRLRAGLAVITATVLMLGWASASVAKTTKPVISSLAASPASVASGSTTTVSASVSGAAECTLAANKPLQGLPVTTSCESGIVSRSIEMPVNSGARSLNYTLTLTATGAGGSSKAKTTVVLLDHSESPGDGRDVTAGSEHTCSVLTTGHVVCWGLNKVGSIGQLGNGDLTSSDIPVEVLGISDATEVSAGSHETCALLGTGHVACWGLNQFGQLGDGSDEPSSVPVEVLGIDDAIQVSAALSHVCAVLATGRVECWGAGEGGLLGDGSEASSDVPVEVLGIQDATLISASYSHSCAVLSTGRVMCWGRNNKGQLGTGSGSSFPYTSPVEAQGITDAAAVSAGGEEASGRGASDAFTCVLLSTGHVECWGANKEGQLGDGTKLDTTDPTEAQGISEASELSTHSEHACALLLSGHIDCWGANGAGALGDGTYSSSDVPVAVQSITDARSVGSGPLHTCTTLSTGHVKCWGESPNGALGHGKTKKSSVPVEVSGL